MSDKRYSKVEEEIIEILDRLEHEGPAPVKQPGRVIQMPKRRKRSRWRPSLPRHRPAGLWLVLSVGTAVAAYLVRNESDTLTVILAVAAIVLFFVPLFFRGGGGISGPPRGIGGTKTWRGRDISFDSRPHDPPSDRLRKWIDDRRGGPPVR